MAKKRQVQKKDRFAKIMATVVIATAISLLLLIVKYYPMKSAYGVVGDLSISGGSGTVTSAQFVDSSNSSYFINPAASGNSLIVAGNIGIGTTTPAQKLSVAGTIESTSGGFKFPDATTQTTAATASSPHGKQLFTSSGTFTVPASVTTVWVSMSGGGGGGGNGYPAGSWMDYTDAGGGGGGGGDAVNSSVLTVTAGASHTITIGAGGAASTGTYTSGGNGGSSSFGSLLTVAGGGGGGYAGSGTGGARGTAGGSGGVAGGSGVSDAVFYNGGGWGMGGDGGGSMFGAGGIGAKSSGAGSTGGKYGGGGGGGVGTTWQSATVGGAGAPGFVLVEW